MLEQTLGNAACTWVVGFAPGFYSGADLVYEGEFDEDAGIVEGFRGFGGADVASGAAACDAGEEAGFAGGFSMLARVLLRGGCDGFIDGGGGPLFRGKQRPPTPPKTRPGGSGDTRLPR